MIGIATSKSSICANNYLWRGKIDLAYQTSLDSLRIAEESGDIFAKGPAYTAHGTSCFCSGLFDEAADSLIDALAFSEKMNEPAWGPFACCFLGNLYIEIWVYDKAKSYFRKGISILENARILPSMSNLTFLLIALTKVLSGDADINFAELYEHYRRNNLKILEGWDARCIGEILLKIDDQHMSEAEAWIKKAIESNSSNGMMWHLGRDYALYAELFKRKGNKPKAKANLNKSIEIMKECGADGWVGKYKKKLEPLL